MNHPTVVMLHTVPALASALGDLAGESVPKARVVHMVDETLLRDTIEAGSPPPHVRRRLVDYARFAEESDGAVLLVTCSSIGEAAEAARPYVGIPVLRIDEPMADIAAERGGRIGVLATLRSTLDPTTRLIERAVARREAADARVTARLVDGAFTALRAGDAERHDAMVRDAFAELASECDVIVLAQASMARTGVGTAPGDPLVLTSPTSGVAQLATRLDSAPSVG